MVCAITVSISHEEKYPGGIVRRDHTATVISAGTGMQKHLYVNGQGITVLSTITKAMAHLPLGYLSSPPHAALTICFGMGTTFRSTLSWGAHVTVVELIPGARGPLLLDGASHFLQEDRPDEVTAAIRAFVAGP